MDCIVRLGNGRAIGRVRVNVFVIRAFVKMREALRGTPELARKLAALEKKLTARLDVHEAAIVQVLRQVMQILNPPPSPPTPPRRRIGFHEPCRTCGLNSYFCLLASEPSAICKVGNRPRWRTWNHD
jgi:hypothetical protein